MSKDNDFIEKISEIVMEKAIRISESRFEDIAKIAYSVTRRVQEGYFREVSSAMDKYFKPRNTGEENYSAVFSNIHWKNLKSTTRAAKGNGRKWRSGEEGVTHLQDFLTTVSVEDYFPSTKLIKYQPIKIRNSYYRRFALDVSLGHYRTKRFIQNESGKGSKTQETKITGVVSGSEGKSNEELRPLFEPMAQYYVKYKIPRKINEELKRNGYKLELK